MLFWTDNPEKNGPKVEKKLRKELGATEPIPFEVEIEGQYKPGSIGQVLGDMKAQLFGGRCRPLYTFRFTIGSPRPAEVRVSVIKEGGAIVLGSLTYSAPIAKPVPAPLQLEDAKVFSKSKFIGEPQTAEKLNGNKDLIKAINKFVRTEYSVGDAKVYANRYLQVVPFEQASLLTINTLPRATWMGLGASFDVQPFFGIVSSIENTL